MARAVVVGAGIVGLTTGLALRQVGVEVVVVERSPQIRAAGASLGLWSNALAVFERLSVAEALRAVGKPSDMRFHGPDGGLLDTPGFGPADHRYLLVPRSRLNELLADALGSEAVRLGAQLAGYSEDAAGVTATFTDGSTERADLLVGADGIHSAVRAQLLPGTAAQEHPGHHVWRAVIPADVIDVTRDVMVLGHHRVRGGYARTHDGHVYWLVNQFDSPPVTGGLRDEALARAVNLDDGGWNPALAQLIAATPDEEVLHHRIMVVPPLEHWTSARVALAGDAAHAMSPHITAGASLGIEDAALLADLLSSSDDVPAVLAAYERDRVPHYQQVQALADAVEHAATPQDFATHYAAFTHWMTTV